MTDTPFPDFQDPATDLVALDRSHIWHPFTQEATAPPPVPIASAEGAVLRTPDGREILDMISSWWVTLHGHAQPEIADAIAHQARTLEHVIFAGFTHAPAVEVAERLTAVLPQSINRVFFSDNGSTAVEVALKLAVQYHYNKGDTQRRRFLAFQGGYHGDTFGAMSAGRGSGFFQPFASHLFSVDMMPWPETWAGDGEVDRKEHEALAALDEYLDRHAWETVAMIMEPLVQGASGMRMVRPEFMRAVVSRLRDHNVLVIFDEVMTGFGRTGRVFAASRCGLTPDLMCLSKGLTGGALPLAVTACRDTIYQGFLDEDFAHAFAHGHSFTANPLGCAAAAASLKLLAAPDIPERLQAIEARHRQHLAPLASHPRVTHPRVTGTIAALTVASEDAGYTAAIGARLKAFFLENNVLIRPLGNVIYLMPPYCITEEQLDHAWHVIGQALDTITE